MQVKTNVKAGDAGRDDIQYNGLGDVTGYGD